MRGFKLTLQGDMWRVRFTRTIAPALGELDEDNLEILINPALEGDPAEVFSTILHELDHYPITQYEGTRLTYRKQERIVREQEVLRLEAIPQITKALGLPPWPGRA